MPEAKKTNGIWFAVIAVVIIAIMILAMTQVKPNSTNNEATDNFEVVNPTASVVTQLADSNESLVAIQQAALAWSSDAKTISCSGSATVAVNDSVYGYNAGKFANWNCFFYSAKLNSDTTISWENGVVETKPAHITYGQMPNEIDPSKRLYFNIADFNSADKVVATAVNNGLNLTKNFPGVSFGSYSVREKYSNRPVWEVREYDRINPDTEIRVYYIDAKSGELLTTVNSN